MTAYSVYLQQLLSISGGFLLHPQLDTVSQAHKVFMWLPLRFNLSIFLLYSYLADLHDEIVLRNMAQNSPAAP
jgi:hypothetical protein